MAPSLRADVREPCPAGVYPAPVSPSRPVVAVIPALDEEATITAVVTGAVPACDEVVVVDNASTDATGARAARAGARVVREPRRGYGAACLTGALAADPAAVLLFLDGDGSDDPAALATVTGPVLAGEADLVLGSRALGRREVGSVLGHQMAANRAMAAIVRARWGVRLTDLGPLRAIARTDLVALRMRSATYGWPLEMVVKAARGGLRVAEVPVDARARAGGESKVSGTFGGTIRTAIRFAEILLRDGVGPRTRAPG
jgi:glycosyltransferase involved in cell wall biosynthesis